MNEGARTIALLMEREPDIDDAELVTRVMESGIGEAMAHELVAFVPLAFARYAFRDSGVTFKDCYARHCDGRIIAIIPLLNERAYAAAWAVAEDFFESTREGGNYLAIAGRSAELRAINELLNRGSELENVVMSEPLVCLPLRPLEKRPSWWKTLRWLIRS